MKGNHGAVYAAVREWVAAHVPRAPDAVQVDKAHGREERREIWGVASQELGTYLAREYGWPRVFRSGRVRRSRRRIGQSEWQWVKEAFWVAGGSLPVFGAPQALAWLRGHWEVENRIFGVRDVSYAEDRAHARVVALALSSVRTIALNLIRLWAFVSSRMAGGYWRRVRIGG